jgi:hypothetical protein
MTQKDETGWKSKVDGWLYNLEISYNQKTRAFHPHIHVLALGSFWKREELSDTWSRYARQRGLSADPRLGAHVSLVKSDSPDALMKSVLEVCKYTIKPLELEIPSRAIEAIVESMHCPNDAPDARIQTVGYGGAIHPRPDGDSSYWKCLGGLRKALAEGVIDLEHSPDAWAQILNALSNDVVAYNGLLRSYDAARAVHQASHLDE